MFQSLGPSIVIRLLDLDNRAIVTLIVASFLTTSALVAAPPAPLADPARLAHSGSRSFPSAAC